MSETTRWGIETRVIRLVNGSICEEIATRLFRNFPSEALAMDAYRQASTVIDNLHIIANRPQTLTYHDSKMKAGGDDER